VLAFISHVFPANEPRPSFISYDNACGLLRHVGHQNIEDTWIRTTRFIVDAWHYINHKASDLLCCTRCNPCPENGSQPDLVYVKTNPHTQRKYLVRAFNTEAAEQLNAWLDGFEAQLGQMTDYNYDFTAFIA
ncbi:hypothetical protein M422DRAFT_78823, partial [Sphaerobolus stellatus SS14]